MYSAKFIIFAVAIYLSSSGEAFPGNVVKTFPPILPYFMDTTDLDTLKLVQVVHRHGDRYADKTYPLNQYKDPLFATKNKGQLTDIGKNMAYELGRYLRARYDGFLSPVYSFSELYATCSDFDRTLMTCQTMLAGLFPPAHPAESDPSGNWNEKLKWQPIPIHMIQRSQDNMLMQYPAAPCPKDGQLSAEIKNSSIAADFDKKFEEFYAQLTKNTGWDIHSYDAAADCLDILAVEKAHGFRPPSWANEPGFAMNTKEITKTYYEFNEGFTKEHNRLRVGRLFTTCLENMEKRKDQTENPLPADVSPLAKFHEFSGHANTVYSMLNALGAKDMGIPPYASAFILELHKGHADQHLGTTDPYFVKVFYRNETNKPAYDIKIPGCGSPCSLDQFKQLNSHLVISQEEWVKECQI